MRTLNLVIRIKRELLSPRFDGYHVARRNYFFGRFISYCGLYPDYSIRLFDRRFGAFNETPVHESFQIDYETDNLKNHMNHIAYESVNEFYKKQKEYADLSTKKRNLLKALISPIWVFFKIYFLKLGFLEGWRGIVIAVVYSLYTFRKYSK